MTKTAFNLQTVENGPAFRAYAAGFAEGLRIRLHNNEGINAQELSWLQQFHTDPDEACRICAEAYALDQINARLTT